MRSMKLYYFNITFYVIKKDLHSAKVTAWLFLFTLRVKIFKFKLYSEHLNS